jgi:hypothetical protein
MAAQQVGNTHNVRRLLLSTFAALRKDGVFHLLDKDSDTYLLLSVDRVIRPYWELYFSSDYEQMAERTQIKRVRPVYLSSVPKQRLALVRRRVRNAIKAKEVESN